MQESPRMMWKQGSWSLIVMALLALFASAGARADYPFLGRVIRVSPSDDKRCGSAGGSLVSSGYDRNHDGILQDDETKRVHLYCRDCEQEGYNRGFELGKSAASGCAGPSNVYIPAYCRGGDQIDLFMDGVSDGARDAVGDHRTR